MQDEIHAKLSAYGEFHCGCLFNLTAEILAPIRKKNVAHYCFGGSDRWVVLNVAEILTRRISFTALFSTICFT